LEREGEGEDRRLSFSLRKEGGVVKKGRRVLYCFLGGGRGGGGLLHIGLYGTR